MWPARAHVLASEETAVALASGNEVVQLESANYRRAETALARAFFEYNLMVYAAPDPVRRRAGIEALYGAILWDCFRWGEVSVTRSGTGAACWLPPERARITLRRQIRAGMLRLPFRFGLNAFRRLLPYDAITQRLHHEHAHMPHWYLAAIGVEPEHQGQGVGGALMQPILDRADGERRACYLETHREANVRLYERHGFEVVCRADVPGHPVPVWAMLRKPR
jgi:ribosomal protein S18 acetylase RimI-like enzyme